jgi:hypothetical protein
VRPRAVMNGPLDKDVCISFDLGGQVKLNRLISRWRNTLIIRISKRAYRGNKILKLKSIQN